MNSIQQRIENITANIEAVKERYPLPREAHQDTLQLICFGPSLRRSWGLIDPTKPIATVSGAHDFIRERGYIPTYHVEFDWRAHKANYFNHTSDDTLYLLASCCSPAVSAKVYRPSLWHADQGVAESEFIRLREPKAFLVGGGSSTGLRSLELFYARGFRNFDIHGMDCSIDEKFGGWAGQHHGERKTAVIGYKHPSGVTFKTTVPFLLYASQFKAFQDTHTDATCNLFGDGLLQTVKQLEKAA